LMIRHKPESPLFPYTTLFRSEELDKSRRLLGADLDAGKISGSLDLLAAIDVAPARHPEAEDFEARAFGRIDRELAGLAVDGCLQDRKSTRLNSSHVKISYAVF